MKMEEKKNKTNNRQMLMTLNVPVYSMKWKDDLKTIMQL